MITFSSLGLSDPILKVLTELGFENPTLIQEQSIPILLKGQTDFIGMAQTGTGKTAAFGLPLLDLINPNLPQTQALILAPTRELGQQIGTQLQSFGKYIKGLKMVTVYGGAPIVGQIKSIKEKNPHIIIATPGRLMDLMDRKVVDVSGLQTLVLDEADEMLNMGFKEDIDAILKFTPTESTIWLFSATMPPEIRAIVKNYMVEPKEVKIAPKSMVNENIAHHFYLVNRDDKTEVLVRLLDSEPDMLGIIFCRTKVDTQQLADELTSRGYPVEALHGDLNQTQRDKVMQKFKAHKIKLVAATDVAARGIDVKNLTHVIHHSLPDDVEYYTHRSGRTARAGEKGISITLATKGDLRKIQHLERTLKVGISKVNVPTITDISHQRIAAWLERVKSIMMPVDQKIIQEAEAQFALLSKSELIRKILALEISKMNLRDIRNVEPSSDDYSSDGGGRKRERRRIGKDSKEKTHLQHGYHPEGRKKSGSKPFGKAQESQPSEKFDKGKRSRRGLSRRRK